MNRENFEANSAERVIFDFTNNPNQNRSCLKSNLLLLDKSK
jgi:hypothetical protein